jgi:hypothetical protein
VQISLTFYMHNLGPEQNKLLHFENTACHTAYMQHKQWIDVTAYFAVSYEPKIFMISTNGAVILNDPGRAEVLKAFWPQPSLWPKLSVRPNPICGQS